MSRDSDRDEQPLADVEIGAAARAKRLRFNRDARDRDVGSTPVRTASRTRIPSARTCLSRSSPASPTVTCVCAGAVAHGSSSPATRQKRASHRAGPESLTRPKVAVSSPGPAAQRPRPRTPRSSQPRWWASSWRTVRSTCARSRARIVAEVALQRVLVDDDPVGVDVAGDGAADVVAVGVVLVTAAGDDDRRALEQLAELARAGRRAPASRARRTRSAAGRGAAARRGRRCGRPAAGTRARASPCRSAPRSPRR